MTKVEFKKIRTVQITREWNPNLAFKYRTTAEHKRRVHAFHKFKNHREKVGLPVRFCSDPLAEDEIRFLRYELEKERNPWLKLGPISAMLASISLDVDSLQREVEHGADAKAVSKGKEIDGLNTEPDERHLSESETEGDEN